jgi:hypothetical protein
MRLMGTTQASPQPCCNCTKVGQNKMGNNRCDHNLSRFSLDLDREQQLKERRINDGGNWSRCKGSLQTRNVGLENANHFAKLNNKQSPQEKKKVTSGRWIGSSDFKKQATTK